MYNYFIILVAAFIVFNNQNIETSEKITKLSHITQFFRISDLNKMTYITIQFTKEFNNLIA